MEITKENIDNFKDAVVILFQQNGKNQPDDDSLPGSIQFTFNDEIRGQKIESKSAFMPIASFSTDYVVSGASSRKIWTCNHAVSTFDENVQSIFREFLRVGDVLRLKWEGARHYNQESQIVVDCLVLKVTRGKKRYSFILDSRMCDLAKYPSCRMVQGVKVEEPETVNA